MGPTLSAWKRGLVALRMVAIDWPVSNIASACGAGWSFRKNGLDVRYHDRVTIYGIPYSEHSSFAELRECVKALRPLKVIPTVNASNPAAARRLVDR